MPVQSGHFPLIRKWKILGQTPIIDFLQEKIKTPGFKTSQPQAPQGSRICHLETGMKPSFKKGVVVLSLKWGVITD